MSLKRKKEIQDILLAIGITEKTAISLTNGGHYRILSNALEREVVTSSTPSDARTNLNLKAELRKNIRPDYSSKLIRARFSTEEKKIIAADIDKNLTAINLTDKYGVAINTVSRWILEHKQGRFVVDRAELSRINKEKRPTVLASIDAGLTAIQAADKHNVNIKTVYSWITAEKKKTITHLTSGKVERVTPEERQSNRLTRALEVFSTVNDEMVSLQTENARLKSENDEMKAKFSIMSEAFNM